MTESKSFNRIVISACSSGSGKTTVTTALLSLFKERGFDVHGFKCGPDYIDPMYHEQVLGIASKNLDPFFSDEELLKASFVDGAGEFNIIEGCMGLYDGLGVSSECSSYSVAKALNSPIVLLVDGYGMGYSILALIKGFLSLDDQKLIKGVFLNRVSAGYYEKLKPKIESELGIRCVGFLPKQKKTLESRHLGLKSPKENEAIVKLEEIKNIIADTCDMAAIIDIAASAGTLHSEKTLADYISVDLSDKVVAVALDEAFSFYYKDNLKSLELAGAKIKYFSPMRDDKLPEGTNALYLGGGYPELYLKELSTNKKIREAIYWAVCDGMPTIAECGGFMYLQKKIDGQEMVGVFADQALNKNKLVRFGYVMGFYQDYKLKGHEFHHYDVTNPGDAFLIKKQSTGEGYNAVWKYKNCIAGFPHFYFLSDPDFLKEFK